MLKFFSSKRAQVRGIDFGLAMIIFMLTMTQILLLTDNFIETNRTHQSFEQKQSFANGVAHDITSTTGLYNDSIDLIADWAGITTVDLLGANWVFGLSNNETIDPYKLGRLANNSLDDYYLSYDNISQAMDTLGKEFRIEVLSPINISISQIGKTATDITVNGTVEFRGAILEGADIRIFVIDQDSVVDQLYTTSDTNGSFSVSIAPSDLLTSNAYSVIAMANYGGSTQDVAFSVFLNTAPSVFSSKLSIFEGTNNLGHTVRVNATKNDANANITALYYGSTGLYNYSYPDYLNTVNNYWNASLGIPENGMVVFVLHETDGTGALTYSSMINFPVTLDSEISMGIEPQTIRNTTTTSVIVSMRIRGILIDLRFTIWE